LDFGLAKAMDPAAAGNVRSAAALTNSPTISSPAAMTSVGVLLGTAAYMSPEQARGRVVDKRADIWSFGVVLYEMLTGARAFGDEDVSMTLSKVLQRDPDFEVLPPSVPARVCQVLRVCLRKDPKQRAGDIRDVCLALDGAFEPATANSTTPTSLESRTTGAVRALPWAIAALLLVALGIAAWAPWRSEKPVDRPLVRLDVDLGADAAFPATNASNGGSSTAISPDGTRLVYISGTPPRLLTRRLDQPKPTELPGTQGASRPFFSPDGHWVGFAVRGRVNRISVEGGAVIPLASLDGNFAGASWAEDGSIFVDDAGAKGLLQLPADGGAPKIIVAPEGSATPAEPQVLPGGKAVVFTVGAVARGIDTFTIDVLALADGRRKTLVRGGQSPQYLPSSNRTGHLLYLNKATLFAIPFDLETLETRGTAVPVLDDVAYSPITGAGQLAVSRTGTLIYRRATGRPAAAATLQWLDAAGKKEPLGVKPGAYRTPRLSPDGKRIALVAISEGANQDIWVYDPQRDASTPLTFGGGNTFPVWSPDGQYVVFGKVAEGIFQARADGATQPQVLIASRTNLAPWSFLPDGKRLAYFGASANGQLWTVPLAEQGGLLKAGTPEPFLRNTFGNQAPSFSPDGHWLAYSSNESGRTEVYVRAFPPPASGQGGKWQVSTSGGAGPRWSHTGHELVYQSGDQLMTVSYTVNGTSFVPDKPRVWIASLSGAVGPDWDLAADGKRVVAVIPEGSTQASAPEHDIVMLLNFSDELRRRVPLGK
jgi:serine/threonine-protein kinase